MDHSNTISFQKFSKLSNVLKKKCSAQNIKNINEISIDIGQAEPLSLAINSAYIFNLIWKQDNSVCYKISYVDGRDDNMLHVKWSGNTRDINAKGYITANMINKIINVPIYRSQEIYRHMN